MNSVKKIILLRKSSFYFILLILGFSFCIFSCKTISVKEKDEISVDFQSRKKISRKLLAKGKLNSKQLVKFFLSKNLSFSQNEINEFAQIYIIEAKIEGINSDVAFAQMCLETGFLRFGGLVTKEMNNFCGLGSMNEENPGCVFNSKKDGIRAHIQHLQAYATSENVELKNQLIDPRYNWVHKTKLVDDIFGLSGTWATDKNYGNKIDKLLNEMESFLK